MSMHTKEPNIGIICEGPSDFQVINTIVQDKLSKLRSCHRLFPPNDARSQNGWVGVWRYCKKIVEKSSFSDFCEGANDLDAIIFCLDGDQSREGTHYCALKGKPPKETTIYCKQHTNAYDCINERIQCESFVGCPYLRVCPHEKIDTRNIDERVAFLHSCVRNWLNVNTGEPKLLIVIPCDMIEAWVVAGINNGGDIEGIPIEQYESIFKRYILQQHPDYFGVRLRADIGKTKTKLAQLFSDKYTEWWPIVIQTCSQARAFYDSLELLLAKNGPPDNPGM